MVIVKNKSKEYVTAIAGVRRKTLAIGEKGLLGEFLLEAGAILPPHTHPHEQIGYLVSGALDFIIDGQKHSAQPGDSWAIPGNIEHAVNALETSVAIEVFVPVREDYLD